MDRNFLDRRSSQIRYMYAAFFKHGAGHAFECLGWLCPATFIFRFSRHQHWHFASSCPAARDVVTRVSGRKWVQSTELDIVNGSFFNLCALAVCTYLRYTVPTRPKKDETVVHCCDPALSVLVMLVSRNVFHVVSALQSIALEILYRSIQDHSSWRKRRDESLPSLPRVDSFVFLWRPMIPGIREILESSI